MNMMFLSVKYGRLQKYDSSRKRSDNAQIIFIFSFILFYHFRFCLFDNYFHFDLALKVDKILKTILENRKLPFSFSSLTLRTTGAAAAAQPENSILGEQ